MSKSPGSFQRALRVGRLGLGLTGSYLGYQFQNVFAAEETRGVRRQKFNQNASRRVRQELEQLKGPLMKIGQLLSMQTQALPEEVIAELSKLQMRAPGMHASLARAQFFGSCGRYPEAVFREFDPEPFAAASLGQVHRAVTRTGERVAVKIQYPAIRAAIQNDFKLLRSASLPGRVTGHVPKALLDEVETGFLKETDYLNEARNLEFFHEKLKGLPFVQVPRVLRELTTDRVLVMSHLEGWPLGEFLALRPGQALRNLIGARMFELFQFQRFRIHAIHADPHPGNYLFDAEGRIGLVDFGCVKELSADFYELLECLRNRVWVEGEAQRDRMIRLIWGRRVPMEGRHPRRLLQAAIDFSEAIFPPAKAASQPVDFGNPKLVTDFTRMLNESARKKLANPEFAFSARSELGFYNLLHQLKAKVNTQEVLSRALGLG